MFAFGKHTERTTEAHCMKHSTCKLCLSRQSVLFVTQTDSRNSLHHMTGRLCFFCGKAFSSSHKRTTELITRPAIFVFTGSKEFFRHKNGQQIKTPNNDLPLLFLRATKGFLRQTNGQRGSTWHERFFSTPPRSCQTRLCFSDPFEYFDASSLMCLTNGRS